MLEFLNQLCSKIENVWPIAEQQTSLRIFVFWKKNVRQKLFYHILGNRMQVSTIKLRYSEKATQNLKKKSPNLFDVT